MREKGPEEMGKEKERGKEEKEKGEHEKEEGREEKTKKKGEKKARKRRRKEKKHFYNNLLKKKFNNTIFKFYYYFFSWPESTDKSWIMVKHTLTFVFDKLISNFKNKSLTHDYNFGYSFIVRERFIVPNSTGKINNLSNKTSESFDENTSSSNKNSKCTLKNYYIWNKTIFDYFRPNTKFDCEVEYENNFFKVKDGVITLLRKNHASLIEGQFKQVKNLTVVDCDLFNIKCFNYYAENIFEDVVFHIRKIKNFPKEETNFLDPSFKIPKNNKLYDVHIYVIDSLSYYHAKRALQRTRDFLLKNLNGIEMKYLNVVGENSRPNAYGFLLNKQMFDIKDIFETEPVIKNDFGNLDSCDVPLDNKTYIQEYYRRMGYITLIAEDFQRGGAFNYPFCIGFQNPPAHHTLGALQYILEEHFLKNLTKHLIQQRCITEGFHILEFASEFLQRYQNKPKMSIVWHSDILHDSMDKIFAGDDRIYSYFKKNEQYINNSFTIVMGDHGYRMSSFFHSEIGAYEVVNPYLLITIPNDLKSNKQLIKNLQENSNKHISMFDIYATLLDLLTNAIKDNFTNLEEQKHFPIVNDTIKGLSLLRPLPKEDRTCYEMYIPPHSCMCEYNFMKPTTPLVNESIKLRKNFIKALNNKLVVGNITDKCAKMRLDETEEFLIEIAVSKNSGIVYKINAITLPGKAKYEALMNKNFEVIDDNIIRKNLYKDQAEVCENASSYRKYCYCKILLKKEKEPFLIKH
uniref:Sulfatase domain-containing protein n=1 Tax=Strongyloides stercoralis TaxID=6248 RepID=A0A0K0E637_STRER